MDARIFESVLYKTVPAGQAKNVPDGALCADVYVPSQGDGPFPVVFYWHGGGWMGGDRSFPPFLVSIVETLHQNGIAFVSFTYRLAGKGENVTGDVAFPLLVHDTVDGLRFFLANAAKYHLDPTRFALFGISAGAHLALMAGLAGDHFGESQPRTEYKPSCILDFCGPTDLHCREEVAAQEDVEKCLQALLGDDGITDQALCYLASPATYACTVPYLPPVLAVQGQEDELVHKTQPETLQKIYQARGGSFSIIKVEHGNHGFSSTPPTPPASPTHKEIFTASIQFLLSHLQ
jgi:acetyl esterase/lipase